MRRDWREVLGLLWGLFLVGTAAAAAPQEGKKEVRGSGEDPVKIDGRVELEHPGGRGAAAGDGLPDVTLGLTEGRVVEAIPLSGAIGRRAG